MVQLPRIGRLPGIFVAMAVLVADILTKEAVLRTFTLYEAIQVTPFFNLGLWLNPGAAFSLLGSAGGWQRYLFSGVAIIAIAWLGGLMLFGARVPRATRMAYALISGGAAGNLYDRLSRGAVVDWIDLHWAGWHWPAFNLADCAIVLGAALWILNGARSRAGDLGR